MLQKMLKEMSGKQFPVTLLLDSLDQLDPSNSARQLTWLPTSLPDHVKVIVSTLPEVQYEAFPKLQVSGLITSVHSCSLLVWGAGIACLLEHRAHDRKAVNSNPGRFGGKIFFSRVNFVCRLFIRCLLHPHVTTVVCKRPQSFC